MIKTIDDLTAAISTALGAHSQTIDLESGLDMTKGWDSLKNMEIILSVESCFGVRFTAKELLTLNSVSSIYSCLQKKGGIA